MSDELKVWRDACDLSSYRPLPSASTPDTIAAATIRAYGDERHAAGYQAAIADVVAMIRAHVNGVEDDNRYWDGPHQRAEWRASEVIDKITRRFGKDA